MSRTFVLYGSNIEPGRNFVRAVDLLRGRYELVAVSAAFRTAPVGDVQQDDFINAAVELAADDDPPRIRAALHDIESIIGRRRDAARPFGPRSVDLDLVFVEGITGTFGSLELPAPVLARESFAAVPVAALAPDLVHPGIGVTLGELARRLAAATAPAPRVVPWEDVP